MEIAQLSKGKKTREDIIIAAHALFAEQGYHGTSMRQIAERAGVALGGIYNHFSSKEDIFKLIIIEYHPVSEVLPKLDSIQGTSVPETVHFAAHTIQSTLEERGDYINLVFVELIEFQGQHLNTVFEEVFPRSVAMAKGLLEGKGLRSKNFSLIFLSFLALMFAFFIINRFINQRFLGKIIQLDLDEAVDLFLFGIMNDQKGGRK